jgi:hypothetical protein
MEEGRRKKEEGRGPFDFAQGTEERPSAKRSGYKEGRMLISGFGVGE